MSIRIVFDHPRAHSGRRLLLAARAVAGALLVCVGLVASIVALPATFGVLGLVLGYVSGEGTAAEPWPPPDVPVVWVVAAAAVSLPLTIAGLRVGLRLMRGHRRLVLFLRRFGYDEATLVTSFAAARTIGTVWRLVTLDDEEVAPVGLSAGARGTFGGLSVLVKWIKVVGQWPLRVFPAVISAMWVVVALQLLTAESSWLAAAEPLVQIMGSIFEFRLPFDRIEPTLPGAFAALGIVAAVAGAGMLVMFVAVLAALPLMLPLYFFSSSLASALGAEQAKTRSVSGLAQLQWTATEIARLSTRVFAPRLVVLRVASALWQPTVEALGRVAGAVLIDVSDPTESLLWEVETLASRFGERCVLIGHHQRLARLAAGEGDGDDRRLMTLLEGRDVLAYTTDAAGARRFARALRARLLAIGP